MKEITTIITMDVTVITKVEDDMVDETLEELNHANAEIFEELLGADKVDVKNIKHFVADKEGVIV